MRIDFTGKKFGRLTALKEVKKDHAYLWVCLCICGNKKAIYSGSLRAGLTKSCGCLMKERKTSGAKTHGASTTRIYWIYRGILNRCQNKNVKCYKNYGGRGIKCFWKTFEDFYKDMGSTYTDELTIERVDVNGNYCKKNCKWITMEKQALNRRNSHFLTYNGKTQTMTEWANEIGIPNGNLWNRIVNLKWPVEKALTYNVR